VDFVEFPRTARSAPRLRMLWQVSIPGTNTRATTQGFPAGSIFLAGYCVRTAPFSRLLPSEENAVSMKIVGCIPVHLTVNGRLHSLDVEAWTTLLDLLRETLLLTGTKKGCDHGQCGACTILVNGRRIYSCLTLAAMADGAEVVTVEGLGSDALAPLQQAFIERDAFQCGYCTPGQIMSAAALIAEGRAATRDDVRELMSGNLCRCGAYPNIVDAIMDILDGARRT
jgi:xanthine dehydrogenase YagT iron-sulfur-binding subunit